MKNIAVIHGLNSTSHSFAPLLTSLPRSNFYMVDYDSSQSLEESISQCEDQVKNIENLHLIGFSLGGVIAAILANKLSNVASLTTISAPLGGSKTASFMMLLPGASPVFADICEHSPYIKLCGELNLSIPALSIITQSGLIPFTLESGDGVVSTTSQATLRRARHIEINASHFGALSHPQTSRAITDFLYGENNEY